MEFTQQQSERLTDLNNRYYDYHHKGSEGLTHEEKEKRHELTFRKNLKQTYGLRLQGDNKYYYAYQIAEFIDWIEQNGIKQYSYEEIKEVRIGKSHYCHEIKVLLKDGGTDDFKSFNDLKTLLGFIEGFNSCKDNWR